MVTDSIIVCGKVCREDIELVNAGELCLVEERSVGSTNGVRVSSSETCHGYFVLEAQTEVISRLVGDVQRVPEVQRRTSSQRVAVKSSKKSPSYREIIPLLASERYKACLACSYDIVTATYKYRYLLQQI